MRDEENNLRWESYFYPGSNILINNYGIKNYDELKTMENTVSFERLIELNENPLDLGCGKEHLKELHRYIFEDIYPFAGEYRKVNMTKERGGFLFFNKDDEIDDYLDYLFEEAKEQLEHCYGRFDFAP